MQMSSGIKGTDGREGGMGRKREGKKNMGRTWQKYIIYSYDNVLNEE